MAKKEAKKENNKNKKSFFKDFKAELKKVVWPTPKQLVNNTVAVVSVVLVTATLVFVLDLGFETLNKQGINKVKELVGTTNSVSENTTENENQSSENENTENQTTEGEEANSSEESSEQNAEETSNTETETPEQNADANVVE